MSFNLNKIIFTQKRSTIFILLFATLFSLFCSSSSSATYDQSQTNISQVLGENPSPTCSLEIADVFYYSFDPGICYGLSAVWLYSKWLQFTYPEKVIAYNGDWYKSTVSDILGFWSDCDNIKKFALLVKKLQKSQYDRTFEKEMNQLDFGKKTQKEYSISSLLTLKQLQQLLKENIIHDHKLVFIYSHNHTTALFKDGDGYYYFNPNSSTGECKVYLIDEVAELIFIANRFDRTKSSPLALEVFSFDKQIQNYPSQREILDRINPSLVSENDYANETTGLHLAA